MEKAVVLLSGGINSSVAAAIAREQYDLALLHIAWGHRAAERELLAFQQMAAFLKIEQTLVADLSCVSGFTLNGRVNRRMGVEDPAKAMQEKPASFMFGLIPTMLSVAATWAHTVGAKRVIIGTSENHGTGVPPVGELYPDYRPDFVQSFNLMLHFAKPRGRELSVYAPLIDLTRAEVVHLGQQLRVPFEKTWSCFTSSDQICGRCQACATRQTGFIQAGIPDPFLLQTAGA